VQAKFQVGQPGDKYEQEADRVAEEILRQPEPMTEGGPGSLAPPQPLSLMRSCAPCDEELRRLPLEECEEPRGPEEEVVTMLPKELPHQTPPVSPPVEAAISGSLAGGSPLPGALRDFYEPRFGQDFSGVRLHTDAQAAAAAQTVQARAFTQGRHIVLGAGEYAPETERGKKLLAHELTHVVQQKGISLADTPLLQRMEIGDTNRQPLPGWYGLGIGEVPPEERERVLAAIEQIRTVANDPDTYEDCHRFFEENCPGGNQASLSDTFATVVLWKINTPLVGELGRAARDNIGYSQSAYDKGEQGLAQTLVHEMLHICGISGDPEEHYLADVAGLYCIGFAPNILSITLGPTSEELPLVFLLSYRRILEDWVEGRIQVTTGADVNILAPIFEIPPVILGHEPSSPTEYASLIVGVRGRTNLLWGGEQYGGLTGTIETGMGVGRFALRSPEPGEGPATKVAGDLILQVGVGAEFYIPFGQQGVPVSIEAAYRLAQPLTGEAERIQSLLLGPALHF